MVSHYTMQQQLQKIEYTLGQEERMYKILEVYMNLFPVLDAYLLRYSPLGFLGEGIIALTSNGMTHIRELRDDIRSLPIIHSAINDRQAKFCSGIEYFKQTNSKYIFPSKINSLLVVPISFGSFVFGYICSSEFEKGTEFDDDALSLLTLFGKYAGEILLNSSSSDSNILSKRELEVMQRIAMGESTKEIADSMEISELTVKQYIKSSIKKLGAKNRTHAVAELFRNGIIK